MRIGGIAMTPTGCTTIIRTGRKCNRITNTGSIVRTGRKTARIRISRTMENRKGIMATAMPTVTTRTTATMGMEMVTAMTINHGALGPAIAELSEVLALETETE